MSAEEKQNTKTFVVDIQNIAKKPHNVTSEMFSKIDRYFIATFSEKKEMLRQYRDIPMALG